MLFDVWHDDARRRRWYGPDDFEITAAIRPRSLEMAWNADAGGIAVTFAGRGAMKSQATVEQRKLGSQEAFLVAKRHWAEALERLREHLAV